MRHAFRYVLALTAAFLFSAIVADTTGCAAGTSTTTGCTVTPFISPTSVTLDHTATGTANSQTFTTGYNYSDPCAVPAIAIAYTWAVSDTIDAAVTSNSGVGTVSCVNASLNPITVYSTITSYSGTPLVATTTPTNLPTATLTCK